MDKNGRKSDLNRYNGEGNLVHHTVRLRYEQLQYMKAIAAEHGTNLSEVIRYIFDHFLDHTEAIDFEIFADKKRSPE